MCLALRGLRSFRRGRGHVVCVCVPGLGDCLEGFVTFRECGDVASFCGVRVLACDDASCWLPFLSGICIYICV